MVLKCKIKSVRVNPVILFVRSLLPHAVKTPKYIFYFFFPCPYYSVKCDFVLGYCLKAMVICWTTICKQRRITLDNMQDIENLELIPFIFRHHRHLVSACIHGGWGNLPWFRVQTWGWSPRTPPHSCTMLSEKHDPFIYFPYRNFTHSYSILQILPIHILFGWKRYPIDILLMWKWYPFIYLEAWKVYPFQPHICIYLYNGSYPPCMHKKTPNYS